MREQVREWPSAEMPLTLIVDSVDQLDDINGGRRLEWLPVTGFSPKPQTPNPKPQTSKPKTGLSAHVRVVVSTLPDPSPLSNLIRPLS